MVFHNKFNLNEYNIGNVVIFILFRFICCCYLFIYFQNTTFYLPILYFRQVCVYKDLVRYTNK